VKRGPKPGTRLKSTQIEFDRSLDAFVLIVESAKYGTIKTTIDADDVEKIQALTWCAKIKDRGIIYFESNLPKRDGKTKSVKLHRLVMNAPVGVCVDHR
jgi:hypothetical protein